MDRPGTPEKQTRSLTSKERIAENLKEAYDPDYYESIYRQMNYAFGEPWDAVAASGIRGGGFPDFPAIKVKHLAVGQSRRILNSAFVDLARIMYRDPSPEFPQVDKWTAEVRKQFYLERSRGSHGMNAWGDQLANAFIHGNGLGTGIVQVGVVTNPDSGLQQVTLRHSPTIYTLWDPYESTIGRARYICFVQNLSLEKAVRRFGKDIEQYAETVAETGGSELAMRAVRIFEYYDLGWGGSKPTMAVIPQDMSNAPILHVDNPFGNCLPFAHYEHFWAPGMSRAIGRIPMQMSSQEAINEIERAFRRVLKRPSIDYGDPNLVEEQDFIDYLNGNSPFLKAKASPSGGPPVGRIPADEIAQTALAYKDHVERQFNSDAGQTEYDRGTTPQGDMTKFEVETFISRASGQGSWSDKQAAAMMTRVIERTLYVASKYDRDPLMVDVFGSNVWVNIPEDPRMSIAEWMEEPSRILVSEDSMRHEDSERKRLQRLAELRELAPWVQAGLIDPAWFTEEILRAAGEQDPSAAMTPGLAQGGITPAVDPVSAMLGGVPAGGPPPSGQAPLPV